MSAARAESKVKRAEAPVPVLARLPDDLLARSPEEGARMVALFLVTRAAEARAHVVDVVGADVEEATGGDAAADAARPARVPRDPEALHDFRVAVRRLRVVLSAFKELRESVGRGDRRRLRALARATNAARDAEVQLAWLAAQRPRLYSRQRAGAALLRTRLTGAQAGGTRAAADAVGRDATRTFARLARALPAYTRAVRVVLPGDHPTAPPTFAGALAVRLRTSAATLGDGLASLSAARAGADVGGAAAESAIAHEARLAAKRVRYLLTPVAKLVPDAPALLDRLRALQDAFGTLHDLDVLGATLADALGAAERDAAQPAPGGAPNGSTAAPGATSGGMPNERVPNGDAPNGAPGAAGADGAAPDEPPPPAPDPRPGLQALARRAHAERDALAAAIGAEWLDGGGTALVAALDACAAALDQAHAPPAVEIERKYLLRALPRALRGGSAVEVEQGYLPGDRLLERVRRTVRDGRERFVRTVKLGAGVARIEVEEDTTPELFAVLWPATREKRVRKRRYAVAEGDLLWEVDEFTDRDLVVAEVELPAADTPVGFPSWLAPYVVREVTDDPAYLNSALAKADEAGGG